MCIICNMKANQEVWADKFLGSFHIAGKAMREACYDLLMVSEHVRNATIRRQYLRIHKKMVKITRDWNRIEHEREKFEAKLTMHAGQRELS